jgi:hypothetical protein
MKRKKANKIKKRGVAQYNKPDLPEFEFNPFIEALPPLQDDRKDVYKKLRYDRRYDPEHRKLSNRKRRFLICAARRFFAVTDQVLELEESIGDMIRDGYLTRNPTNPKYFSKYDSDSTLELEEVNEAETDEDETDILNGTPLTETILGLSGTGKSYSVERILNKIYAQVITHIEYSGAPLLFNQVVYIKINCSASLTVRGIYLSIIAEVDKGADTTYFRDYKADGLSKTELFIKVRNLCHTHGIGLIVIDEIQSLVTARGKDREDILDFFTVVETELKVPILNIGTPKAAYLFSRLHTGRRAIGANASTWKKMEHATKDDIKKWRSLVKTFWTMQYTKKECPFTEELSDLLYDLSQGIMDFAVKAFFLTQIRAIKTRTEAITSNLLISVVYDHFKPAKKLLDALRNNDMKALEDIDDVALDFDSMYRSEMGEDIPSDDGFSMKKDESSPLDNQITSPKNGKSKRRSTKIAKPDDDLKQGELREIIKVGVDNGDNGYEALKKAGKIKLGDDALHTNSMS